MKENSNEKTIDIIGRSRLLIMLSMVTGVVILLFTCVIINRGIALSQAEAASAEIINKAFAGEYDLYPASGVVCELEARVLDADSQSRSGFWYHETMTADYGDTIEVRLKAIAADPADADPDAIISSGSFSATKGLRPLTTANDHANVMLPDGSLADYLDEFHDEHVTYIALGTFELSRKDWLSGKSASVLAFRTPDGETRLDILPPYGSVDVTVVGVCIMAALMFGLIIPLVLCAESKQALTEALNTEET